VEVVGVVVLVVVVVEAGVFCFSKIFSFQKTKPTLSPLVLVDQGGL